MRYFFGSLGMIIGVLLVWKTFVIANAFGQIDWAEEHLGAGGTYTLYKAIGVVFVILSALYLFGIADFLFYPFRNLFGGFRRR